MSKTRKELLIIESDLKSKIKRQQLELKRLHALENYNQALYEIFGNIDSRAVVRASAKYVAKYREFYEQHYSGTNRELRRANDALKAKLKSIGEE